MPFQDFTRRLQGPPQPLTLPEYDLPTQIEPMDEHQAAVEKIFGKSQPNFAVDVPDNWTVEEQKPQTQPGKPPKYQTLRDLMPKQQRKAKTISARKPGAKTGTMPGTVTARNPLTGSAFDSRPKANNEFDLSLGGPSEAEQMVERALVASGQNVGRDTSRKRSFLQKVQDQQAQDIRSQRLRLEGVDTGETKFDPASLERAGELQRMRKQVESENPLTRFGRRFLTTAAGGLKPDEEFINAPVNRAEDAVNSLMDAATRGIASMPEGFARIADNFLNQGDIAAASAMQKILANHPDMTPAEKTEAQAKINKLHSGLSKMGDYIEPISKMGDEAAKGLYPRDPNAEETINPLKADFWSHTMPQAAGSMLPFMAASGVGGALKIAPELVAGGAGMAMEVPEGYHEARAAGATPEQLARTVDIRMAAGGTEALGAESLFGNFGKKLEGNVFGYVTKEGAIEGIQEGGQRGIEDVGDKYYSKTKPELTAGQMTMNALQNAVPALFLGAGGGAMGIPAHLAERNHQKIAEQIEQVATTQPDHPVAQTIAAVGIDPTTVSKADDKAIEQLSIRLEAMAKMDSQIQQIQGQQAQVQQQILNAQQAQQMGRVPSTVEAQAVQQAPVVEQQLAEAEAQQAAIVQDLQQNVSPLFKNLAKAIGRTDAQPISDVADDPKANLLTEVRKAGGIAAGEGTVEKGELDRLGIKEAGTTGIISRTGGESADRMRERMASEELTEAETPQQFIGELEAATKKGKTEAESYADYQRSQMTEQEIADSDKLDEVLADKTHPFTQIYRTLDNPKTIFTKDLAKKFDAAAQQAGFSDDFIERSLVEFQNQRATNPNAKVVEKNLPDSELGRSMKPAQPGTSVSMSDFNVLKANNKESFDKLHNLNLNSSEARAEIAKIRDWARANNISQHHVGNELSHIEQVQKKYGIPQNPDAQSSATRALLGTEVKAPQPARKEAAPASSSPSGFSQEQRKLLGTDHTNLLDSEFDEYLGQLQKLQSDVIRDAKARGIDTDSREYKELRSKIMEVKAEREVRRKAGRLPSLTSLENRPAKKKTPSMKEIGKQMVKQERARKEAEAAKQAEEPKSAQVKMLLTRDDRQQLADLGYSKAEVDGMTPQGGAEIIASGRTKATAPKAELGEQLVEQAAGQTEKPKVNTWNVSQSQFIEESLGRLKESRAGGTLFTGKSLGGGMGNDTELAFRNKAKIAHRQHVEEALASGQKVSPDVLADYPDLAKRETTEVPRETANVPQRAEIDEAAHEAATSPRNELPEPTEAQIEAGNYKKGHISIHGLDVTIENPKGSTRSGVGEGGKKWSVEMSAHYGYVKRTEGADGEQIDVYIGDKPESSKAFVVDQIDLKTGKFDEHKVILGAESQTEAEKLYDAHFSDKSGPSRRSAVTEMSVDGFKEWLKTEDNTKPAVNVPQAAPEKSDGGVEVLQPGQRTSEENKAELEKKLRSEEKIMQDQAKAMDAAIGAIEGKGQPKELWEKTIEESGVSRQMHRRAVKAKIDAGQADDIPERVLTQYPELYDLVVNAPLEESKADDLSSRLKNLVSLVADSSSQIRATDVDRLMTSAKSAGLVDELRGFISSASVDDAVKKAVQKWTPEVELRPLPAKNSTRRIDGVIHVLDSVERVGDFDFELWESGVNGDLTMVTRDAETGDVVDGSVVIESNPKTAKKRFKDKVENARQSFQGERADGQVATAKPVVSGETAGSAAVAESGEAEGKRDASTAFPDTRSSLESVFDDWVDSEVDAPKETQPKREKSPTQPAKTRTEAKPATVKTKTGIKESNAKFAALFGKKTVKPGPPASRTSPVFDQAIYDQAKPLFEERLALSEGMDDATALRALLDSLKEEYGDDALPIIIGMKPYILHFMEERKGVVSTQEATDERSITSTESDNLARSDGRGSVGESGTIENTSEQSKKENGGKSGSSPDRNTSRRKRGRLRSQTASLFADDELQSSDESSRVEGDKQLAKVEEQTEPIAAAEAVVQAAVENVEPEAVPEVAEPEPKPKPVKTKPQPLSVLTGASFAITPEIADRIRSGGAVTKYKQNIDAVKTMRQIVMEGRRATVEEQEAMALYAGFGGIKDLFAPPYQNYKEAQRWYERQKELKELIGEDAYKMASASTKNAHFTDPQIVDRMWTIAEKLGFTKGRMLEPSMGSGNFFGLVPAHLRDKTTFTGVELDKTTGQMAQLLYPDANIHVQGFEDFNAPDNFFDLAMGNVPFGEYRISDNRYNKLLPQIHNYFFLKALDKVRPGGLVMFITSTGTMDSKRGEVVRKELAKQADLVTAIRFPAETFGKTALTSVVTDLIILRKRMPSEVSKDQMADPFDWETDINGAMSAKVGPITLGIVPYGKGQFEAYQGEKNLGVFKSQEAAQEALMEAVNKSSLNVPVVPLWVKTSKVADPRGSGYTPVQINSWMAANRQNMLGDFNGENRMYPGRANVDRTDDFEQRFTDAIAALPSDIMSDYTASVRVSAREAGVKFKEGGYVIKDGQLMQNVSGGLVEVEGTPDRIRRVEGLIAVRDAFDALIDGEMGRAPMGTARKDLNSAYDKFFGKYGSINDKKNREAMAGDPDLPRLMALESYDPKKKTTKKQPIFTKATVVGSRAFSKPENVQEGVIKSFQMRGEIILSQIADDLGLDEQTVAEEMVAKKIAFQTPQGNWELAAHYLSGNVRRKLAEAKVAVASDSFYQANVNALEDVVPRDIQHTQIAVEMGAPWMEPDVISRFVAELFGDDPSAIRVHYDRKLGSFTVGMDGYARAKGSQATTLWGIKEAPFADLLDLALKGTPARIMTEVGKGSDKKLVFNPEKTQAANTKLEAIKKRFKEWLWENDERRERLLNRYNDLFNSQRPAEYDVKFMLDENGKGTVPGLASHIKLREHQVSAVFRAVIEKRGLLAHEVGLGKTLAMLASASELKRMGIARKPAIAVPKKVISAFVETAQNAFPLMKVHVIDSSNAQKRNTSMSQVATGDHDLILMTHDNMDMLKMKPEFEAEMLQNELDEVNVVYNAMKAEKGAAASSKRVLKQIENRRSKLEAKINDALKSERKDNAISFEDTGIDFLFIDEFHKYKSLPVVTALGQVKGVPTGDSQRAMNMLMRARYLQRIQNGGGLIAATGTPISNTLVEAWIMSKFLQPDLLEESGVESFDAWVRQFAETVPALEMGATGEWKTVSRMSKFKNLPELQVMSRMTLDVKTAKETGILDARPKRIDKVIQIPQTQAQAAFMQVLRERAAAIKNRLVEPWEDNYLVLTSDGMQMALDPRMVLPGYKEEGGKIKALAENVARILEEKPGNAQMIFCDSGVAPNAWGFHLYEEIIKKLEAGGIPRDKIINFSKLDTDKKVEAAVARLNSGDALIALGHRENMGTGINAQKKLAAVHQFDVPWKPALVEQSEARAWRQGNENTEVEILPYVVEGSFDSVKWSTIARKQQGIAAFMQKPGEDTAREWEDGDDDTLSYDQIAAAASGDGDYLRKAELDAKVFKLSMMQQAHDSEALTRRQEIPRIVDRIAAMERRAVKVEREATAAKVIKDKEFAYQNAKKETIEDRKDVAKDISSAYLFSKDKHEKTVLGYYKGLRLMDDGWGNSYIELPIEGSETEHVSFNVNTTEFSGTLQSIERKISGLASDADAKHIKETVIPGLQEDLAKLQAVTDTPFPFTEQLQKARAQSDAVNKRLQAKEAESAEEGEPLQADGVDVRAVSALGRQLRRDLREKAIKPSDVAGILEKRLPEIEAAAKDQMEVWKAFQRRKAEDFLAEMDNDTGLAGMAITAKSASKIQAAYDPEIDAPSSMPPPASRRTRESVESSPEFKKWFGQSVVTDNGKPGGKPLVLYHGTGGQDFSKFETKKIIRPAFGYGFHLSTDSVVASKYAAQHYQNERVVPAYVTIKNPASFDLYEQVSSELKGKYPRGIKLEKAITERLSAQGYDGIIYEGSGSLYESPDSKTYVAFSPNQIKSATGNSGAFDASSPYIAASRRTKESVESSPEFKKWFGDSKVVDAEGKPVPVYHGTQSPVEIGEVKPEKFDPDGLYGPGFYMTQSPDVAAGEGGYAMTKGHREAMPVEGKPHAYKLYASIKNPLDMEKVFPADKQKSLIDAVERLNDENDEVYLGEDDIATLVQADLGDLIPYAAKERIRDSHEEGELWTWADVKRHLYGWESKKEVDRALERLWNTYRFDTPLYHTGRLKSLFNESETMIQVISRDIYYALSQIFDGDLALVNEVLQKVGFDGITHIGGQIRGSGKSFGYNEAQAKAYAEQVGGKVSRDPDTGEFEVADHRVWIAFEPNQVKSVFNRGTFDETANLSTSRRTEGGPASKLANPMDVLLYQQSIVKDRGSRGARMYVNDYARAILGASLTEVFGNDYSNVNAINLSREEVKQVADYLATEAKELTGDYKAGADGFVADLRELLSRNKAQRTFNIVDVSAYEARHQSGIRSDQERAAENLKGDIREEGFHWSQREINGQTVALVGASWAQSSKGFGKYRKALLKLEYPDDAETLAAETAAKIAAGKFDDLGIRTEADHEQAQNWLASYFERVAEKHGIEALEKFDRLLPKAKEAKAKGAQSVKERLRERIEQEQAQSGGTNRPRAPGGESQRVRGTDEGRQENGAEEVRRRSAEEPFESAEPVKGPQLTIDERTNAENVRRPGEEAPEFSSVKGTDDQPVLPGIERQDRLRLNVREWQNEITDRIEAAKKGVSLDYYRTEREQGTKAAVKAHGRRGEKTGSVLRLPYAKAISIKSKIGQVKGANKYRVRQAEFLSGINTSLQNAFIASAQMNQAKPGSAEFLQAEKVMDKARLSIVRDLSRLKLKNTIDTVTTIARASLLSAPHIPIANVVEGIASATANEASKLLRPIYSKIWAKKWGIDTKAPGFSAGTLIQASKQGASLALADFKNAFKYHASKVDMQIDLANHVVEMERDRENQKSFSVLGGVDKYDSGGRPRTPVIGDFRVGGGFDLAVQFVFDMQNAADAPVRSWVFARSLGAQAKQIADNQAKAKGWNNKERDNYQQGLMKDPTPLMVVIAGAEANNVIHNEATALVEAFNKGKNYLKTKSDLFKPLIGLLDLVVPFTRIPSAAAKAALWDYAPWGGLYEGFKGVKAARLFKDTGIAVEPEEADRMIRTMGQSTVGTSLYILFATLAAQGMIGFFGSRDDDWRKAAMQDQLGEEPGAMKIGDAQMRAKRLGPIGQGVSVGGQMAQDFERKEGEKDDAYSKRKRLAIPNAIISQFPLMDRVKGLVEDYQRTGLEGTARGLARPFTSLGALRDVAQATDDVKRDTQEEGRTFKDRVIGEAKTAIPGVRNQMPPKIGPAGKPMPQSNPFNILGLKEQSQDRSLKKVKDMGLGLNLPKRESDESAQSYGVRASMAGEENRKIIDSFFDDPNLIGQPEERKKVLLHQELSTEGRARLKKIAPEDVADDRMVRAWIQIGVDRLKANPVYQQMSEMEQKHALQSYYGRMNRYKAQPANGQHEYLRPDTVDENVLQEKIKAAISSQQDN